MDKSDRKNAVGIAFSGGGLQGIAHIGAVKALHELGIFPDFVSGTSSPILFQAQARVRLWRRLSLWAATTKK